MPPSERRPFGTFGRPTPKPPAAPKLPDFCNLGEAVTFIIGPQKKTFFIHKKLACDYSPVLKAAFIGSFLEGQTQTYTLEDTTEEGFGLFCQWVYTQKLDGDLGGQTKSVPALCRVWVLAGKLLMPRLQNIAIDKIEELRPIENTIHIPIFQYVWDNTVADSPLRRIFISQCVWTLNKDEFRTSLSLFPKEMLSEMCYVFRDVTMKGTKFSIHMADFHVKED